MAPDFERLARMPWPNACCASSGTKPLSSALALSCSRCASRVRTKISAKAIIVAFRQHTLMPLDDCF
jgi:hypothetical protein